MALRAKRTGKADAAGVCNAGVTWLNDFIGIMRVRGFRVQKQATCR